MVIPRCPGRPGVTLVLTCVQIIYYVEDVCSRDDNYVSVRLDYNTINKLQLELTIDDIVNALVKAKLKIARQVFIPNP